LIEKYEVGPGFLAYLLLVGFFGFFGFLLADHRRCFAAYAHRFIHCRHVRCPLDGLTYMSLGFGWCVHLLGGMGKGFEFSRLGAGNL
jgi:hypothetical protein